MMVNNSVTLIGHIGNDLEIKPINEKTCVLKFSLATHRSLSSEKNDKSEITDWHYITAFNSAAQTITKFCKKGSHIALSGSLRTSDYIDKQGTKRFVTDVVVDSFRFLK